MTQAVQESTQSTTEQVKETLSPVQLHVADIVNGTTLLKIAIERGAFKAEEIAEVGGVYSKLSAFVQYLQQVAVAESQAASNTTPTADAEPVGEKKSKKTNKKSK